MCESAACAVIESRLYERQSNSNQLILLNSLIVLKSSIKQISTYLKHITTILIPQ